jgi:predicted nucleotidyltransferase
MISGCYTEKLQNVFKKYEQIAFAYLFGSVANGEQTALSDVDIAVYISKGVHFSFEDTLHFQGDCCRVLKRNDVDVLVLNNTRNLILLEDIIRHGRIIYNTDSRLLDDFELNTLHVAHDFKWQRLRELGV